jgi:hypothetical protein
MVGMGELSRNLTAARKKRDAEVFRSPAALAVWWVWLLFAVANLIDLAVQGRDHLSVVAAATLLVITGLVYVTALRPKIVADDDGLTIVNPFRDHRVGWAAVTGYDATDLLRVRCAWPSAAGAGDMAGNEAAGNEAAGNEAANEAGEGKRAIYSWAVHSSRRRAISDELRAQRQRARGSVSARGGFGTRGPFGGYGQPPAGNDVPPPKPLGLDAGNVIAALTAHADKARAEAPEAAARPPVSAWRWPAIAAILIPVLVLVIAVVALGRWSAKGWTGGI